MTVEAIKPQKSLREEIRDELAAEQRREIKGKAMKIWRQLRDAQKIVRNLETQLEAALLEAEEDEKAGG